MAIDLTQYVPWDLGSYSTDPERADYASAEYQEMAPRWQLVADLRTGTPAIRAKNAYYLPRFEYETDTDYAARILMTFAEDHYATTLVEHVGLVFAIPPKVEKDVPARILPLLEDIDGEGNHVEVFAETALDAALHWGHAVLWTDYPVPKGLKWKSDERRLKARPYVTLYGAPDVLTARYVTVGGVRCLVEIKFRGWTTVPDGAFGTVTKERFRIVRQAVISDPETGKVTGLGAVTWELWAKTGEDFALEDEGEIIGPNRICARVIMGGERLGAMHSKPHLIGLAYSNTEETQVKSDNAAVMHKTNVPTPVFIGRMKPPPGSAETIQMGQGIDLPIGGDAKMLEPSGAALGATRLRLEDLRDQMRRQGATMDEGAGAAKTAAEARLLAAQRNAKLVKAARSLQDALEGMLEDIAAFLKLPEGGSISVNRDFAGEGLDPAYLAVLVSAYNSPERALSLEALMYALKTGHLPEDFSAEEEALRLVAQEMAREDEEAAEAKAQAEADAKALALAQASGGVKPGTPKPGVVPAELAEAA